jgi:hypothetical protein
MRTLSVPLAAAGTASAGETNFAVLMSAAFAENVIQ